MRCAQQITIDLGARVFGAAGSGGQSITHGSGGAYNPSRQNAAVLAPVIAVKDSIHQKMRVAGQDVDVLVGLLLESQQVGVNLPAALRAYIPIAHAVA